MARSALFVVTLGSALSASASPTQDVLPVTPALAARIEVPPEAPTVHLATVDVVGGEAILRVVLDLPEGRKLSAEAPSAWSAGGVGGVEIAPTGVQDLRHPRLDIPITVGADGEVDVELIVYHCAPNDCQVDTRRLVVPVRAGGALPMGIAVAPVGR